MKHHFHYRQDLFTIKLLVCFLSSVPLSLHIKILLGFSSFVPPSIQKSTRMPSPMADSADSDDPALSKRKYKFAQFQHVYVIDCDQDNPDKMKKYYGDIHERTYDDVGKENVYVITFASDDGPDGELHKGTDIHAMQGRKSWAHHLPPSSQSANQLNDSDESDIELRELLQFV